MSTPNNQQELAGFIVEKVVKVLCERETFEEIEAMIGYFPRQVLISTVKVLCEDGRPAAIRVLVALMRSHALVDEWDRGEWYVGDDVREALLKIGEPAVEPLIQSFKSQRADKSKVVEILGRIGGKRALEFLLETQNYPDNGIQVSVKHAPESVRNKQRLGQKLKTLNNGLENDPHLIKNLSR